jgi:hypothetical protein
VHLLCECICILCARLNRHLALDLLQVLPVALYGLLGDGHNDVYELYARASLSADLCVLIAAWLRACCRGFSFDAANRLHTHTSI